MPKVYKTTPREIRARWYREVEQKGKTIEDACDIFGVSRKTYYKWYNRDHGYGQNRYRPRRIHPHTKITKLVCLTICEAKLKYNYGPLRMKEHVRVQHGLTISTTAIYKYFKKKKLIRKPQRKQKWYTPLKQRYLAIIPGENVQLDVKYVPGPDRTWNYQFRFIDTVTNMQYAIDCLDKSALATIYAFRLAKQYFPFDIIGIQTDNGSEFRGRFAEYLLNRGIIHRFIPKRSAPWNGKVERANRSVDDEYYLNVHRPWNTLAEYVRWYNYERYHTGRGMNGLTPYQKYRQCLIPSFQKVSPLKVN